MTSETFDQGMQLLTKQWPNHPVSLDVYWHVLRGLDDQVFQWAIVACLETCKFFPVIAEIREKSARILNGSGLLPKEAEDAWEEAKRTALCDWHPDVGWLREPGYSNDLIEQTIRALGGLERICLCPTKDLGWLRKEFMDFYEHKRQMEIQYNPDLLRQALPAANPVPEIAA